MRLTVLLPGLLFISHSAISQNFRQQYFDGADTSPIFSVSIQPDTAAGNIWQIGKPQKTIFNSASSLPNALVTDTIQPYVSNNISRFGFTYKKGGFPPYLVFAVRWKQKLDMEKKHTGGIIEFSVDSGTIWQNVFNNSLVYNFYGFSPANKDTLNSGEYAFSGTDTAWTDIWLCFRVFNMNPDSVLFRFTFKSDTSTNVKEGWMLDNFRLQPTFIHTVSKGPDQDPFIKIYPTETTGLVFIESDSKQPSSGIEGMELMDLSGRVAERWRKSGNKTTIDISRHPPGNYLLNVHNSAQSKTFKITLLKQ